MSEIKCRVCGATPEQSESIYEYEYETEHHHHRQAYQCVDFLLSKNKKLREALVEIAEYSDRWTEAEIIIMTLQEIAEEALR